MLRLRDASLQTQPNSLEYVNILGIVVVHLGVIYPEIGFSQRRSMAGFLTIACLASVFVAPTASAQTIAKKPALKAILADLKITQEQEIKLKPILVAHLRTLMSIHRDRSLSADASARKIADEKKAIVEEASNSLNLDQVHRLQSDLEDLNLDRFIQTRKPLIPLFSATYERYFPSNATTRSIFGPSPSSIQFGITEFEDAPDSRTHLSFTFETFGIATTNNRLFIGSPDVAYEYRVPIASHFSTFAKVFGGPSYMDYSFDNSTGQHFGAKRLGLNGGLQVGLRYGRAQLTAAYRAFTQPAGMDFNGIQLDLTYVVVHF